MNSSVHFFSIALTSYCANNPNVIEFDSFLLFYIASDILLYHYLLNWMFLKEFRPVLIKNNKFLTAYQDILIKTRTEWLNDQYFVSFFLSLINLANVCIWYTGKVRPGTPKCLGGTWHPRPPKLDAGHRTPKYLSGTRDRGPQNI